MGSDEALVSLRSLGQSLPRRGLVQLSGLSNSLSADQFNVVMDNWTVGHGGDDARITSNGSTLSRVVDFGHGLGANQFDFRPIKGRLQDGSGARATMCWENTVVSLRQVKFSDKRQRWMDQ